MLKCLIALTTLLPVTALAATIWTWVDAEGHRHYSDTEVPGATAIEISGAQTFSGSDLAPDRPPPPATDTSGAAIYSTLEILNPSEGETLRNIEGNLRVEVGTFPQLAAAHYVDIVLDGQRLRLNARALSLTVPEVWRGSHTIAAVIVDGDDRELIRSRSVTVFVQQASSVTQPGQFPSPGRAPTAPSGPRPGGD